MAIYDVKGPDGKEYQVNGPEGASNEQVLRALFNYLAVHGPAKPPSAAAQFAKTLGLQQAPVAAGIVGFGAGMEAGAPLEAIPGIGTAANIVAGLVGAGLGAYGASKAQEKILDAIPETAKKLGIDKETMAAGAEAHPWATKTAEILSQLEGFKPGITAFKSTKGLAEDLTKEIMQARRAAAANAAIGAVSDVGQQALTGQPIDWKSAAESAAMGAVLQEPRKYGRVLMGAGEAMVPWRRPLPEPVAPPPAAPPPTEPPPAPPVAGAGQLPLPLGEPPLPPLREVPPPTAPPPPAPGQQLRLPFETPIPEGITPVPRPQGEQLELPFHRQEQIPLPFEPPVPPAAGTTAAKPTLPQGAAAVAAEPGLSSRDRILQHIQSAEPSTMSTMREATGLPYGEVQKTVNALKKEGLVEYSPKTRQWEPAKEVPSAEPVTDREPVSDHRVERGRSATGVGMPVQAGGPDVAPVETPVAGGLGSAAADIAKPDVGARKVGTALKPQDIATRLAKQRLQSLDINKLDEDGLLSAAIAANKLGILDSKTLSKVHMELSSDTPNLQKVRDVISGREEQAAKVEAARKTPEQEEIDAYMARRAAEDEAQKVARRQRQPGLRLNARGEVVGSSTSDVITDAVKDSFGIHGKKLLDNGIVKVVGSVDDLPFPIPPSEYAEATKGVYHDGTAYLVANNLGPHEVKGVVAHEIGVHAGMEQMLGPDLWKKLQLDAVNRARGGEQPFVEAFSRVPRDTPVQSQAEEGIAYLVQHRPDLPFVKNIISQIKTWLYRLTNGRMNLNPDDIRTMAIAALKKVSSAEAARTPGSMLYSKAQVVKKVEPLQERSADDVIAHLSQANEGQKYGNWGTRNGLVKSLVKALTTHEGRQEAIRLLQNQAQPIKRLQNELVKGGDESHIYDYSTQAGGRTDFEWQRMHGNLQNKETAEANFIRKTGIKPEQFLGTIQSYIIARAERPRRLELFGRHVPLDNKTQVMTHYGKTMTPADYREAIVKEIAKGGLSESYRQQLRQRRDLLVDKYKDADGWSPEKGLKAMSLDIDSPQYNVVGDWTKQELQNIRDRHDADMQKYGPEIEAIFENLDRVKTQTIAWNKEAGYHPPQLDDAISFYGYGRNYFPFKGELEKSAQLDPYKALSRKLTEGQDKAEGRYTDSENSYLQIYADAAKAAGRVGRIGFADEIARMINQQHIPGKMERRVSYEERYRDLVSMDDIGGKNHIFRYMPNGDIEVYSIADPKVVEAVKGFVGESGSMWRILNGITSGIGRMHTAYNPAFGPWNFLRHAITSAGFTAAQKGIPVGAKYFSAIASKLFDGGMWKAFNAARLYHSGNLDELERLAGTHPFYHNIYEYIKEGGRAVWQQSYGMHTQYNELRESIGPSNFMSKTEQVQKAFRIWNDTFEFASRAAGYGVIKNDVLARMQKEGKNISDPKVQASATQEAVQFTKNLFNYTETGKWGREIGSVFMFLRPAMTTAVRATEALAPAFQSVETAISRLPQSMKDPEIVKKAILNEMVEAGQPINTKEVQAQALEQAKARVAKFLDTYSKNHIQQQKTARILTMAMMGAGYTMYNMSMLMSDNDEQGRNKVATDNMQLWSRAFRMPVHGLLGKSNEYLQLPWGWGFGAFASAGAQLGGVINGKSTVGQMIANVIPIALEAYLPIPAPKFVPTDNPIAYGVLAVTPSFARPFIEYLSNTDEFGKEIYFNRNNQFGTPYSSGESMPELYGAAARMLMNATNGGVAISPSTLQFFANSYIDGTARLMHNAYGVGLTMAGQRDFDPKHDLTILDSFIGKSSSFDAREFDQMKHDIEKIDNNLKMFEHNPDQLEKYLDAHPNAQMVVNLYNQQVNGQLKNIRHQMKEIRESGDMTSKEKEEQMKDLKEMRDWTMRGIIDSVNEYAKP